MRFSFAFSAKNERKGVWRGFIDSHGTRVPISCRALEQTQSRLT